MARRETTDEGDAPPAPTLRSQHVEATRRAVLAAARAAFGTKGYAQTSVDEIAAAARVTKGAVYHHFSGKEALFRAVWAEVEAAVLTAPCGSRAGSPWPARHPRRAG
ncbi:MAG TPA: helix-turn-helix domain-containing protein [Solirubrobacteraceae bacterium]|jgi:AcrR family transcriptional regulator